MYSSKRDLRSRKEVFVNSNFTFANRVEQSTLFCLGLQIRMFSTTIFKRSLVMIGSLLAATSLSVLKGQNGGSFFANFELKEHAKAASSPSMTQDAEGNIEIATLRGVTVFDGANSQLVGTGAAPNMLEFVQDNNAVYVACEGRIGYITRNNVGKYVFTRIPLTISENEEYFSISHIGKDVYFMGFHNIVKVTDKTVTGKWAASENENFIGLFTLSNTVFVNIAGSGLHILQPGGKKTKHTVDDSKIALNRILFDIDRGKGEVVIGTDDNSIYLFTGAQLTLLPCDKYNYIQSKTLQDAKKIDNNQMIISTKSGGLLVCNMYNGVVSESFNTNMGFPDDEIFGITVDKSYGIWSLHEMGLTRIDRNVPVKNFSAYPGVLKAYSVAESNGNLYVGGADGLYVLKAAGEEEFQKVAITAKAARDAASPPRVIIDDAQTPTTPNPTPNEPGPVNNDPGTNKNEPVITTPTETGPTTVDKAVERLRDRLRKAKKKGNEIINGGGKLDPTQQLSPKASGQGSHGYQFNKSIFRYAGLGLTGGYQFIYRKVDGLEGKIKKIISLPNGLACVANTGLFLYSNDGVKRLFSNEVNDACVMSGLLYFTSGNQLYRISVDGNPQLISTTLKQPSLKYLFAENGNTLWIGGTNKAARLTVAENGSVSNPVEIKIPSDYIDNVNICRAGQAVYFITSGGLFEYSPGSSMAIKASISKGFGEESMVHCVNASTNTAYIKTNEGWKELKKENDLQKMGLLDAVTDVRYIFKALNGNYWVTNGEGKIYLINTTAPNGIAGEKFEVFIRSVNGFEGNAFDLSNLKIDHTEGAIEIRWGTNVLLKQDVNWYSYKIEGGGRAEWSPWTNQTSLKIQMKPGSYRFLVKARDVMGHESEPTGISFTIKPPFYQTIWFYLLCAIALGAIIYFIFMWRNKALLENQKLLESMVKQRTVELAQEKEKAESLLLNILPKAVADELSATGKSSVRQHPSSAVMFTDFCDFTKNSKNFTPEELVNCLDGYFRKFDHIVEKYGLEKIKTIGDSYMCAAGVPQAMPNCTAAIVMAGLEILDIVNHEPTGWRIRVGVHNGGLVSGVVGKKKFAYDIWGDTVNIASRMESSSEPMRINTTEDVYQSIKEYFVCEKRGDIEAKSLGKTAMYFVLGLKPEFSVNGNGQIPNHEFLALFN
jgi:class 3 adenylate cyclase